MSKEFNPFSPEYKKVADLPEEHRSEFVDTDKGFVRKEVRDYEDKLKSDAKRIRLERERYLDLAMLEAEEENRLRSRTVEEIEGFNINEDGLVSHGTEFYELPTIIKYGLGYREDGPLPSQVIDFHVIGSKLKNNENGTGESGRFGFGKDEKLYYYDGNTKEGLSIYLVSDVFKRFWPETISTIVKKLPHEDLCLNN